MRIILLTFALLIGARDAEPTVWLPDFTDTGVGCIDNCLEPEIYLPEPYYFHELREHKSAEPAQLVPLPLWVWEV